MSRLEFGLSESEELRQKIAAALDRKLDPRGTGDIVTIIMISIVYAIDLVAVAFLLWNRRYQPLKCKTPFLMSLVVLASILWFAGDIQANGHAPLQDTQLTNCKAFGVWVRILLGVCTVSALIALRAYGLFRVFRRNQPFSGWGLYLPFIVYCACIVVYGVVSQVVSPRLTIEYIKPLDICFYYSGFKASLFVIIWITWIIVAVLSWQVRNIKSSFNESRESLVACTAVFAVLIFTTAMHYAQPDFALNRRLRILTTTVDHFGINFFWWVTMGVPLAQCLFRKDKYLDEWVAKLRADGLQREYDISSNDATQASTSRALQRNSLFARRDTENINYKPRASFDYFHKLSLQANGYSEADSGYPYFEPAFGHRLQDLVADPFSNGYQRQYDPPNPPAQPQTKPKKPPRNRW